MRIFILALIFILELSLMWGDQPKKEILKGKELQPTIMKVQLGERMMLCNSDSETWGPEFQGLRPVATFAMSTKKSSCDGTLACYKCCVGEKGYTKENCEKAHKIWNKGKDCNCS